MFIVDLAVPRDVEPEARELSDVYLYTVDDLASIVRTNSARRESAVVQAEAIIENGVSDFLRWLKQRRSVPLIQAIHGRTDKWREHEIERAKRQLAKGDGIDEVLQSLSRALTQKMLHGAMNELHAAAGDDDGRVSTIARLFGVGEAEAPRRA